MINVAILYCDKIKDTSCVACAKCYKAIKEKNGEFSRYKEINLIAMTDCGGCPGLTIPRIKLISEITKNLDQKIDVIHFGSCMKVAMETANCPIDLNEIKKHIKTKFGIDTVLGTHSY